MQEPSEEEKRIFEFFKETADFLLGQFVKPEENPAFTYSTITFNELSDCITKWNPIKFEGRDYINIKNIPEFFYTIQGYLKHFDVCKERGCMENALIEFFLSGILAGERIMIERKMGGISKE